MLSIAHTIISVPFGIIFQNPIIAFCVAFIVHFLCDRLLHWNIYPHKMNTYPIVWIALDVVSGLGAAYLIAGDTAFSLPVLTAIAGGNMPDVFHALWSALSKTQQKHTPRAIQTFFAFHEAIQRETDSVSAGLISQVILGALAIVITRILI